MALTQYADHLLIEYLFRTDPVYLALYTQVPTKTTTLGEVTGGSYARELVAFTAPASGESENTALITFTTATADWGAVSHYAIYDAVSGGNMIFYSKFDAEFARTVESGDIVIVPAGRVTVGALSVL